MIYPLKMGDFPSLCKRLPESNISVNMPAKHTASGCTCMDWHWSAPAPGSKAELGNGGTTATNASWRCDDVVRLGKSKDTW